MATQPEVRVGIVGTSWWSDAMYLPALAQHPIGRWAAVCGRDLERTRAAATRWNVRLVFTDWKAMLDSGEIDAVIVASPNDTHYPITMAALERKLPVLCEKPIGMNATEALEMAAAARTAKVTTMVPFTYRWMPTNQYIKQLLNEGFVGRPYHLNMRHYAGYARSSDYAWRFDDDRAGAGVLGDLGAHWLDMARWFLGEITEVSASTSRFVARDPRPDGTDYPQGEDSAVVLARFESGALAILQVSAVGWEGTRLGQTHHVDLHGSDGTIHATNDWDSVQEVRGVRTGEPGPARVLDIPESVWAGAPHTTVHDTYRHIFRHTEAMTRGWVTAIAEGRFVEPDLATGARIQQLISAGLASVAENGRWQTVPAPER